MDTINAIYIMLFAAVVSVIVSFLLTILYTSVCRHNYKTSRQQIELIGVVQCAARTG